MVDYMTVYPGPPPPSGTIQSMYSSGILMEQHLQWMQFCALITLRFHCCTDGVLYKGGGATYAHKPKQK